MPQQSALYEQEKIQTDAHANLGKLTAESTISQTQQQDFNIRFEEGGDVDVCHDNFMENHCAETEYQSYYEASDISYDVNIDCRDDISNTDDSCSENENEISDDNNNGERPLYSGSNLTLGASMLLIINFALKYSLTGEGLCHLLELINLHCPSECILPRTKKQFWKWFEDVKQPLKFHKYCNNCHLVLSESDIEIGVCPNNSCGKDLTMDNTVSHFIEVPIASQIKNLFARPSFRKDIQHRFQRKKKCESSIEDIYDGKIYKALSAPGQILSNSNNLSLLWNTDGIPCFKSSNMSLWPLFFQINELPYSKRVNPDFMILGGLWYGSKKPSIISYTEPFLKSLKQMETVGVEIQTLDTTFTSHVIVIGGTADLPARSLVCNSVQFNGKYGCCKCLQPGETCKTSARGHVHIFPFQVDSPEGQLRSHDGVKSDGIKALETDTVINGIKGPTFLQCLQYYDLVDGVCIDYMHGVLLGVTKLLMNLWFSSEKSSEFFSVSSLVDLVDKRIKNIKPPNSITRVPRSIKDHMKYWKASELRSWLLYYSLPVLKDILTKIYYDHYLLFVSAVYLLLQDSVSISDLQNCDKQIKNFCCLFAALYGDRYMTCNVHQLLHLPKLVWDMGPMWCYSCFPFENANGVLLKLYHGTQHVDVQIAQTVCVMQCLPNMKTKYLHSDTPEMDFFNSLKGLCTRNDKHLEYNTYVIGSSNNTKLLPKELNVVSVYLGHCPSTYLTFNRIKIDDEVFHSRRYKRCRARNSYTIAYLSKSGGLEYGQVEFYLQLYPFCSQHRTIQCGCISDNVAMVSKLKRNGELIGQHETTNSGCISHIVPLKPRNIHDTEIIPLRNILYKCVFVEVLDKPNTVYVCRMPNRLEND